MTKIKLYACYTVKIYKNKTVIFFFKRGGGARHANPVCAFALYLPHASSFSHSSFTLISSSLLFEPSMTSGMSEASSNYVFQCLTPLTDSWGPPYDKYHITQLSLAIQAINYPITVSNPAFVLLARAMPALNLGVHQSRNTITNKNIESLICVKVLLNKILGHTKFI